MIDLKPYFDAVNAAEAEVQRVANELDALFRQETDEAKAQALARQPELEKAQAKHAAAISLYEQMQKANRPNDIAKNFVPVSNTPPDDTEGISHRSSSARSTTACPCWTVRASSNPAELCKTSGSNLPRRKSKWLTHSRDSSQPSTAPWTSCCGN